MIKFAERLRELREEKGLSQNQLSKLVDISSPTISRWESGEISPVIENVVVLCDFFKVSAGYIIGLEN